MMSWSKSNHVCIKRFRRSSTWWIFVSSTHCLSRGLGDVYKRQVIQRCVYETNSWYRRPAKTLDANLFWLWPGHHWRCDWPVAWPSEMCACWWWTLRTHALTWMFIYMIHQNILWNCQCNLMHVTNGYFVVNIKNWSCVHMHFRYFDFNKLQGTVV